MRVLATEAKLGSPLGSVLSLQESASLSKRFDSDATPETAENSNAQFFAFVEEHEAASSKVTAVLETSAVDRDRICELLRSLGYKPVGFELRENLVTSLRQGASFDLLVASLDGNGSCLSNDARALRRAAGMDVPLLLIVREVQLRTVAASASAANADFILAPCNPLELEARLRGLRKSASSGGWSEEFHCGCYHFHPLSRTVHFSGKRVRLQPMEFELARQFFLNPGHVYSRKALFRAIWGQTRYDSRTRTIDAHVSRLRKKLDLGPHRGCELAVVYGVGYQFQSSISRIDIGRN
jgi:DNA-binding response OmpR family regulator